MVPPSYLSAAANPNSDEDGSSASLASDSSSRDGPRSRKTGLCGRCHASILCLSHVVGLGNVVRFPYLTYKHGGGAFLIAYFFLFITCGVPLFVMETAIGQYSSMGPIKVWKAVPIFKGVGYSMAAISSITSVYYGVISSWAMLYLVTSMTSVTPWGDCKNVWNTNSCVALDTNSTLCVNQRTSNSVATQQTNLSGLKSNCTRLGSENGGEAISSSVAEYFYRSVVDTSDQWGEPRELRWQLCLCLLAVWVMVALAFIKGIKPGEKATYFLLTLTTLTLLVLFVRASALPGGNEGLSFLFTPQWTSLAQGQLWRDAATQVFFSLSLGSGTLIAVGTYNKFNNDLFTETAIVCSIDSLVSVMSSLVVFAVLGSIGHTTGLPLDAVAISDLGLPFVALSHATFDLPGRLFWSGLSFLTLAVCGVFTCASLAATTVTSLVEVFSGTLKKQRVWLVLGLCTGATLLGLTLMVQDGFNVVNVFDRYLSGLPQLFTSGLVVSAFAWIYGVHRFSGDVSRMINSEVMWWWRGMWGCVCPCFLLILIIISLTSLLSGTGEAVTEQPWFIYVIGLLPLFLLQVPVVFCACQEVSKSRSGILLEKIRRACKTRREWGATERRYSSHVEYFPTVHTHMGIDISLDGLNTVTDRVEFSPVGVRVPSLSQTSLLPVSPGMRRTSRGSKGGKVRDMRHAAILNHAYSNPQCNLSSGSLEKPDKKQRLPESPSEISKTDDVIFVKRKRKKVPTCDASTQTDRCWHEPTLFRQRSQPCICTPKPLLTSKEKNVARSMSWHQLGVRRAVLEIDVKTFTNLVKNNSTNSVTKKQPAVNGSASSSNSSSKISDKNAMIGTSSKDFGSCISDEIAPLDNTGHASWRKKRNQSKDRKNTSEAMGDALRASSGVRQAIPAKPGRKKFNRSISCDDANLRARIGSSSSSNSSSTKPRIPKPEKSKGANKGCPGEKKRRCGQSIAPNLSLLMRQNSLPQGQLSMAALASHDKKLSKLETFAVAGVISKNTPLNKRGFRPETGTLPGRICADTVVRLASGKSSSAEVCALSSAISSKSGNSQGKSNNSQGKSGKHGQASVPVDAFLTSGKAKSPRVVLNKVSHSECAVRTKRPALKRSESETAGRDIASEKFFIRPVVSQPSVSGFNSAQATNEYNLPLAMLPHSKRKRRSKSAEECTKSEHQTCDYATTNSLPRSARGVHMGVNSRHLESEESLSSELEAAVCIPRDPDSIHWFSEPSKDKEKTTRLKHVPALPLSNKDKARKNTNQIPLQEVVRYVENDGKLSCTERTVSDSEPAIINLIDEGAGSRPASSTCSTEEGDVILEETEIDLELDKFEHELLVSSTSMPSSLSSPSPSSTLLAPLSSCGPESSNL
ncbi:sodium-dependent proline transporter-like [Elysia marginata]|uniref:Sodium-dependent proline transporter-like n=1 Tax=Elysia marginata TaxID=1093978 RepID=A0AAV4HNZ6_9GAST|nr:sodium-dependent proline transporter-like [Elysia marginata]